MAIESSICKHCGKSFEYERVRKPKSFCSKKCYHQHYNRTRRDKAAERLRQAKFRKHRPAAAMLHRVRASGKKQGLPVTLTEGWIQERLHKGVCEVTGLPLVHKTYRPGDRGRRDFYSPSIDRIDNSLGYTPSNCRIVCWAYNLIKNHYTDRDVIAFTVAFVLQMVPREMQRRLLNLLPRYAHKCLPSGNPFVDAKGTPLIEDPA